MPLASVSHECQHNLSHCHQHGLYCLRYTHQLLLGCLRRFTLILSRVSLAPTFCSYKPSTPAPAWSSSICSSVSGAPGAAQSAAGVLRACSTFVGGSGKGREGRRGDWEEGAGRKGRKGGKGQGGGGIRKGRTRLEHAFVEEQPLTQFPGLVHLCFASGFCRVYQIFNLTCLSKYFALRSPSAQLMFGTFRTSTLRLVHIFYLILLVLVQQLFLELPNSIQPCACLV